MKDAEISSDDGFESNFDSAEEGLLSAYEKDEDHQPLLSSTRTDSQQPTPEPEDAQPSNSLTQAKNSASNSSLSVPLCVVSTSK